MIEYGGEDTLLLVDDHSNDNHILYCSWLANPDFDLLHWLHIEKSKIFDELDRLQWESDEYIPSEAPDYPDADMDGLHNELFIGAAKISQHSDPDITALEQNTARVKQPDCVCLKPLVVVVKIDGHSCHALLDSGSFLDFISTTVANQLKLKLITLDKPLPLQLTISGSRGKVKQQATTRLQYRLLMNKESLIKSK